MPKENSKPKEQEPLSAGFPPFRYYKGQKKNYDDNTAKAPWDGSAFECQSKDESNESEYNKTFYSKPGVFKSEPIRPGCDNRYWMIGNVAEKMNSSTTYTGVFLPKDKQERTRPYRPKQNGIHYKFTRPDDLDNGESTMKTDYYYKRINDPAMPFRPPVGLANTLAISEDSGAKLCSTNNSDFGTTNLKDLEPVKNCKPIRAFEKPTEPMETVTTTHSEFTGQRAPPAKSCRPAPRSNGI